jgi:Tfp pilus assembly protein PilF
MRQGHRWRVRALPTILLCLAVNIQPQTTARKPTPAVCALNRPTLGEGRAFLKSNELERARASFGAVLARDPACAEAHDLTGLVTERRKDPAAAAPRLRPAHDRP